MKTHSGRKLGRPTGPRFALLRNMATSLLRHEKIETTRPKAKEVSRFTEKLITQAKKGTLSSRRHVAADIHDRQVQQKLFETIAPRFKERAGGYTQFIMIGQRLSDGAEMGILKLVV